jgi:hypothetical protein
MRKLDDPEIINVDQLDNAALVTFRDESPVIYPARLLYAAKEIAQLMYEKDVEEAKAKPEL